MIATCENILESQFDTNLYAVTRDKSFGGLIL